MSLLKPLLFVGIIVAAAGIAIVFLPDKPAEKHSPNTSINIALVKVRLPASLSIEAKLGKKAFDTHCVACHGVNGSGVDNSGPPLIHKIYEPSHHGDGSFFRAVQNGVRAHHWSFGDMPAVKEISEADTQNIIAYIREIQRANGIN